MNLKRVVVTGLGALTPIGNTFPAFWEGLKKGTSGAAPITRFDSTLFKTKFACCRSNLAHLLHGTGKADIGEDRQTAKAG